MDFKFRQKLRFQFMAAAVIMYIYVVLISKKDPTPDTIDNHVQVFTCEGLATTSPADNWFKTDDTGASLAVAGTCTENYAKTSLVHVTLSGLAAGTFYEDVKRDTAHGAGATLKRVYSSCAREMESIDGGRFWMSFFVVIFIFVLRIEYCRKAFNDADDLGKTSLGLDRRLNPIPHSGLVHILIHAAMIWPLISLFLGWSDVHKDGPCAAGDDTIGRGSLLYVAVCTLVLLGPVWEIGEIVKDRNQVMEEVKNHGFLFTPGIRALPFNTDLGTYHVLRIMTLIGVIVLLGFPAVGDRGTCNASYSAVGLMLFIGALLAFLSLSAKDTTNVSMSFALYAGLSITLLLAVLVKQDNFTRMENSCAAKLRSDIDTSEVQKALDVFTYIMAAVTFLSLALFAWRKQDKNENNPGRGLRASETVSALSTKVKPAAGMNPRERLTKDKAELPGIQFV